MYADATGSLIVKGHTFVGLLAIHTSLVVS